MYLFNTLFLILILGRAVQQGTMSEDKPYLDIGRRLVAFRGILKMSQKEFATAHDFSVSQYSNWENGIRRIPIDSAAKLLTLYGLTLDFLYLGRIDTLPHNLAKQLGQRSTDR